jgi:predicted metal-dependent phosphoesterase TrpH
MKEMIAEGARLRRQRITDIFDHLRIKHSIVIPYGDKADILSRAIPSKVHIADAAMKLGLSMTRQEFFDNCLDDFNSTALKVPAEKVIDAVTKAGGVVSFAHPIEVQKEYNIDIKEIAAMAQKLKNIGLAGIEVYHSSHGKNEIEAYAKIAKTLGLYVSGGSDYHGKNKKVAIGQLSNYGYSPTKNEITIVQNLWSE